MIPQKLRRPRSGNARGPSKALEASVLNLLKWDKVRQHLIIFIYSISAVYVIRARGVPELSNITRKDNNLKDSRI